MVEQGRVSLSFIKGSFETYLIVSGIIAENNTNYESKVSFKRVEGEEKLTTHCTCIHPQPCHHSGSLLIKFTDIQDKNGVITGRPIAMNMMSQEGIHVDRYGTLIKTAPQIPGARMNSTFSSLQYTLTNRKVISFPAPSKWKGKLVVNLIKASEFEEYKDVLYVDEKYTYKLSWEHEGSVTAEVSIFDVLYLFNWKTGEAFDQPNDLRELVSKLKLTDIIGDIQDFIRLFLPLKEKGIADLFIEGEAWDSFPVEDM